MSLWKRGEAAVLDAMCHSIEVDDQIIRPEHTCRPPKSHLFGGGPEWSPDDHEDVPVGSWWFCECGKAYQVTANLQCWVHQPSSDVNV
jgi:hypothetical protein